MPGPLNNLNNLADSPRPLALLLPQQILAPLAIAYGPHNYPLQLLKANSVAPIRQPLYLPDNIFDPHEVLLELIVQQFVDKPAAGHAVAFLRPAGRHQLAENHLQSLNLPEFIDVVENSLDIGFRKAEVSFVLIGPALKESVKFVQRLVIFLIYEAFEALGYFFVETALLEEVGLVALLVQDGLEQDEDVFVLAAGQVANGLPETGLVLLGQRSAVLDREVGPQILRKRTPALVDRLMLALGLDDVDDLVLVGPRGELLARAALVAADRAELLRVI